MRWWARANENTLFSHIFIFWDTYTCTIWPDLEHSHWGLKPGDTEWHMWLYFVQNLPPFPSFLVPGLHWGNYLPHSHWGIYIEKRSNEWKHAQLTASQAFSKCIPIFYRLLFEQISVSRFHRPHHLCVWWKVLKPQREAAHFKLLITLSVTPTVVGFFFFFFFMSHPFRRNLQNFRSRNETWHAVCVVVCLSLFGAAQNIWKCLASDTLLPECRTYCLWPALEQSVMHSTQSDNVLIVICHVINLLFWHRQCFGRIILPGMNSQWFF